MFGIGGGEILFIVIIALMLFGSDKIPDIARNLGKGMAQLKNATNEIKHEIQKNAQEAGIDKNSLTMGINQEIEKAKQGILDATNDIKIENPIEEVQINFDEISGPIKRNN